MAVTGVFVPVSTDRAEVDATVSVLRRARDELGATLRDTEADEADLAGVLRAFPKTLADPETGSVRFD